MQHKNVQFSINYYLPSTSTMAPVLGLILILISLALLILYTMFIIFNKNKNLPPSLYSVPIIGHLHLLQKPLHRTLARLSDTHGPLLLLRFGSRPVLLVSSLSIAEECFTKNDLAFANRPRLASTKRLTYNHTTLTTAPYGPHWRNLRRIATIEVFSTVRLEASANARADEVRSMVGQLFKDWRCSDDRSQVDNWKKVKLWPRLFGVSLNVIMRLIAGKRYYGEFYGEDAPDAKEAREFREMVEEALPLIGVSNLSDFLPFLRMVDFQGVKKRMARVEEKTDKILQGLIEEHKRKGEVKSGRKTMIGELLSLQQDNPEYYTDQNIKGLTQTFLFAGTDTSTQTIEWAMSLLLNHPEELQKVREEIDKYVGMKGRFLEEHDLNELPYLQAIIYETLRLYPVAPLLVAHESREATLVGCYSVPRGTILLVNAWAIHRAPNIWADPTKFMPERFVNGSGKILPFGMGRRKCPGEGLAMRVVGLELGNMLQCFEWERVGKDEVEMSEGGNLILSKVNHLEAMYKPHECMIHALSQLESLGT